jgi:adenylate cyclase
MRYLAMCDGPLTELNQLRAPMASVLDYFVQQRNELDRYREKYGDLSDDGHTVQELNDRADISDVDTKGSDTEHV